ncbi:PC4 and SFRS1-interacting protein [Plutella xylostella]|uniref:PC4 and SFRS1-interacting protein n=1 Tax=Plutella xylostella TaxID=51655 RepID=UPI00203294A1|nr:PC4 and SFRS1-interacting protein [Plutella xylostella]XP_037968101.2 PC4 and SFRS1-interacting protein [Plutella xylostella]XP_037968108.2 PC4 and SFRS1-interacting protein [Plutella xylostella]
MGKKAREYKTGDFIFAKVKGYPAWPARVQRPNGKKYFVYFYGTGETANLPPNQIFDYAENKDKFLTKTVKRKDFNDGARQIEHDFANNVPLEDIIGVAPEEPMDTTATDEGNETANDSAMDTTAADTTVAETTTADETTSSQNDQTVEDSDEGPLVIDEGKKRKPAAKTPAKEPAKAAKTPRGKAKSDEKEDDEEKRDEELVSRSGRKIRPKRYIDEQTEENATLPAPAAKKKRGTSPAADKDKTKTVDNASAEKNNKHYTAITQTELEDLKEPFEPADGDKEDLLITCLPGGTYVGIKLFQARPSSFKSDAARLQWARAQARHAITLKGQLEKGHITPQSVAAQLEMDLNLTDEEKANLDKEREIEEKKSRVQFLKTEMRLIELDAKIKSCLSLEKADTELCLKLLDELTELEVKPLMLLKHPTCAETVKRMRAYVGNTPSWELSEEEALSFSTKAGAIRAMADTLYNNIKDLFVTPEGLSFWEYFSSRVAQFKKATAKLSSDERLEMVHEPLEMSTPTAHTMKAAVEAANEEVADAPETPQKKKAAAAKAKKAAAAANSTPSKAPKRQSSRSKAAEPENNKTPDEPKDQPVTEEAVTTTDAEKPENNDTNAKTNDVDSNKETPEEKSASTEDTDTANAEESEPVKETEKNNSEDQPAENNGSEEKADAVTEKNSDEGEAEGKEIKEKAGDNKKDKKESEKERKEALKEKKEAEKAEKQERKEAEKEKKEAEKAEKLEKKEAEKEKKEAENKEKREAEKEKKEAEKEKKEVEKEKKEENDEPRAKRGRENNKKTETPKSPAKRKSRS